MGNYQTIVKEMEKIGYEPIKLRLYDARSRLNLNCEPVSPSHDSDGPRRYNITLNVESENLEKILKGLEKREFDIPSFTQRIEITFQNPYGAKIGIEVDLWNKAKIGNYYQPVCKRGGYEIVYNIEKDIEKVKRILEKWQTDNPSMFNEKG